MRLKNLLEFNDIVIQCHDNPDADAIASGYAVYWYLKKMGKSPRLIYRGNNRLQKSNLIIMTSALNIPIEYAPDFEGEAELLVTVDCQYGQKNITAISARSIAVIDHHQAGSELPPMSEVRSNIGSCATVVWNMINAEGISIDDSNLSTALYYGLYTDTNKLSEISHPLDRDMIDALVINKSLVTHMSNSNITLNEFVITGKALLSYEYFEDNKYLILEAEPCDPNILGVISDFSLETAGVDVCLAYYQSETEIKFSVRSCTKEVHADGLAAYLAEGYGGGGGHNLKAGGSMRPEKLDEPAKTFFRSRMHSYFEEYTIIYAEETTLDTSDMKLYSKIPHRLGFVKLEDVFPIGTPTFIRTLEGDIITRIEDHDYLMIGVEGEIYPISADKLQNSYKLLDEKFDKEFEYSPTIKNSLTDEKKFVIDFARTAISQESSLIYARPLRKKVKVFTVWDEDDYYTGSIGDYIAVRKDDPHDIYVINGHLFDILYKEAST